ncbi:MAG TPA: DUF1559 domain-containing protein [Phycisphaerae bacterium]|nr:DUF1559 domain-containing protein [Phycisphaerae bacterium]
MVPIPRLSTRCVAKTCLGFTLLEVLIVIALIALLAALLLPSLSAARQQARRLSCGANLRAVGMALNLYHSHHGRYPQRVPAIPDPDHFAGLANITRRVASTLIDISLGDPRPLYCPNSVAYDPHARGPFVRVAGGPDQTVINHWETGQISYIYLVGVRNPFPDNEGQPTFDPDKESPDHRRNPRAVLVGDRTVEHDPGPPFVPGSNHRREGGWFFRVRGDAHWRSWNNLAAHPSRIYTWYWPKATNQQPPSVP